MAQTSSRGFASMDPEKQREIARKGGRAAHAKGTAHEFTSDEARSAGRKGGEAVSRNRAHMAEIGRRGGERRGAKRAALKETTDRPQIQTGQQETTNRTFTPRSSGTERIDREVDFFRDREHR
ncbi:MAG TPA: KGG domain-containing protein [Thermoanaerobaculia bacterium]